MSSPKAKKMTFYASRFLRVWKPLTLGVIAIVFLAALLFTTPVTRKFDRFHCEVTIDNVSGTLTLGTFVEQACVGTRSKTSNPLQRRALLIDSTGYSVAS